MDIDQIKTLSKKKVYPVNISQITSSMGFLSDNPELLDYFTETGTTLDEFFLQLLEYPPNPNISIVDSISYSAIKSQDLQVYDFPKIQLPRELRYFYLMYQGLPELSVEAKKIIQTYPNLYSAWKYFPDQVEQFIATEPEKARSYPEEIALQKFSNPQLADPEEILIPYSRKNFPLREFWIRENSQILSYSRK